MTKLPLIRVTVLTAAFLAIVMAVYGLIFAPSHFAHVNGSSPLTPWQAVPLACLLALALATLSSLFISNASRLHAVLRPSWGRILSALLMAGLTPLVVVCWVPWLAGVLVGMAFQSVFHSSFPESLWIVAGMLPATIVLTIFWYLPSCLIISGVKNKLFRVALFSLLWWATYAAVVLVIGYAVFTL